MSDNTEQERSETQGVEQITKVPSAAPKREKDPKRVAAGKKLAENNKLMREEYARYKAEEAQRSKALLRSYDESQQVHKAPETSEIETNESSLSDGFLSQLTLGNVLSLLGVGLSIYALFFKGETKAKDTWRGPIETTFESPEEKQPPKSKSKTKAVEAKSRPKFGM